MTRSIVNALEKQTKILQGMNRALNSRVGNSRDRVGRDVNYALDDLAFSLPIFRVLNLAINQQEEAISIGQTYSQALRNNTQELRDLPGGLGLIFQERLAQLQEGFTDVNRGLTLLGTRTRALGENTQLLYNSFRFFDSTLRFNTKETEKLALQLIDNSNSYQIQSERLLRGLTDLEGVLTTLSLTRGTQSLVGSLTEFQARLGALDQQNLTGALNAIFKSGFDTFTRTAVLGITDPINEILSSQDPMRQQELLVDIFERAAKSIQDFNTGVTGQASLFMPGIFNQLAGISDQQAAQILAVNDALGNLSDFVDADVKQRELFTNTIKALESEFIGPATEFLAGALEVFNGIKNTLPTGSFGLLGQFALGATATRLITQIFSGANVSRLLGRVPVLGGLGAIILPILLDQLGIFKSVDATLKESRDIQEETAESVRKEREIEVKSSGMALASDIINRALELSNQKVVVNNSSMVNNNSRVMADDELKLIQQQQLRETEALREDFAALSDVLRTIRERPTRR